MFQNYYQLVDQPFGVTPDPRYLYLGKGHREAMASVMYGVNAGRGFSALIARPGMGKTTLLFNLLQQLEGNAQTVFLFQSQCSPQGLVQNLLADLGIEEDAGDLVRMQSKLNEFLLRESKCGKRFVVVVDEAQNLEEPVLEVLRMLSNFETSRQKLMHIVLAGQLQLASKLASPGLTQLRQRISIIARLCPLSVPETRAYIDHRLQVAGYNFSAPIFSDPAYELIAKYSEGIPRNINNLCFNAMSLGCALKRRTISCSMLREVIEDLNVRSLLEESTSSISTLETWLQGAAEHSGNQAAKWFRTWSWKVAAVGAAGLALALFAVPTGPRAEQQASPAGMTQSAVLDEPKPDLLAQAGGVTQTTSVYEEVRLVKVKPNQTLIGICRETLGGYDEEILNRVRQLNPMLQDPSYIQSGTLIRIPSNSNTSEKIHPLPKQSPNALAAEVEKP